MANELPDRFAGLTTWEKRLLAFEGRDWDSPEAKASAIEANLLRKPELYPELLRVLMRNPLAQTYIDHLRGDFA